MDAGKWNLGYIMFADSKQIKKPIGTCMFDQESAWQHICTTVDSFLSFRVSIFDSYVSILKHSCLQEKAPIHSFALRSTQVHSGPIHSIYRFDDIKATRRITPNVNNRSPVYSTSKLSRTSVMIPPPIMRAIAQTHPLLLLFLFVTFQRFLFKN